MNGYERFETIAKAYLTATEEQRKAALEMMPEQERKAFLDGVGLYHLLTDEIFYKEVCSAMAKEVYEEMNARA